MTRGLTRRYRESVLIAPRTDRYGKVLSEDVPGKTLPEKQEVAVLLHRVSQPFATIDAIRILEADAPYCSPVLPEHLHQHKNLSALLDLHETPE